MFFDDFFGWDREFYNFERSVRDSAPYKIYRDEKEVTIKNRDWYLTDEEIITYGIAEKIIKKISEIK